MPTSVLAPIALFVYNRPDHARKTLEALRLNADIEKTKIYVFADGPKKRSSKENINRIREVHEVLLEYESILSLDITKLEANRGLSRSVMYGVSKLCDEYGKVIVIEDDIVTGPYFIRYMNDCLGYYEGNSDVKLIGGYTPDIEIVSDNDVYCLNHASVWGWATWSDRWAEYIDSAEDIRIEIEKRGLVDRFNFNGGMNYLRMLKEEEAGKLQSWDIKWHGTVFLSGGVGIYPKKSLVKNIGFDGTGVHCGTDSMYVVDEVNLEQIDIMMDDLKEDIGIRKLYEAFFYEGTKMSLLDKMRYRVSFRLKRARRKNG